MEQILINYTNDEDTFFISMMAGDKVRYLDVQGEESEQLINKLKEFVESWQ